MKALTITLDIWKWQGCVLVGGTSADCARVAKSQLDIDVTPGDHATGHARVEMGKPWLLWSASLEDVPCLVHEAMHITAGILEARGLKYTEASEEAYTYTTEYILRQILTAKRWDKVKA